MSTFYETLEEIDKNIESSKLHRNNVYLRNVLEVSYFEEMKLDLPPGVPPFKKLADSSYQNPGAMWQIARKIKTLNDLPKMKREIQFIQWLESVSGRDVDLLLHIKGQTLFALFPSITWESLNEQKFW